MQIETEFAIIGGGVAGLTAAIGLNQLGCEFLVFEQAKELKGIGAGFGLAANAMQALDLLGLKKGVEKIGFYTCSYNILDQCGNVLLAPDTKKLSRQYNQDNFTIHRADLHFYLLNQLPNENVILGKKAIHFEENAETITVSFEDGSTIKCKYLLIADGVKSPLRQQLLPHSTPRYSGYTCWRATIDKSSIQLDQGSETWGKQGRFGMTPLVGNRIYWYACVNSEANNPIFRNYTVEDLTRHFKDYHSPIPTILAKTKNEDLIWNDIIDIKPLTHLAYGNILLLGDAGHATTPNLGQGACQALEDVAVLMDELKITDSVPEAFRNFEKRRLKRTKYITDTSKRIGEISQWDNPLMVSFRNTIMKLLPARIAQSGLAQLLSVDFMKIGK
ncbi:FAD-dependent monooxygenase [Sphingobacterium composti Ten et al. 2007 non Yoo et al. 2007]|uniref:FAD-dependent monooxygenase n=1 Tax=Sphingobacterium composti TaxID=363260 RepID=UPI00135C6C48|nr:FAD-dependent monooxygenase [Sphingobacterium composti Ten et al. 2007 non Yoo et al. 2007]